VNSSLLSASAVGTVVAVGTTVVDMVVVALFLPLTTLHNTFSIECVGKKHEELAGFQV
jgi:hypothetical protein